MLKSGNLRGEKVKYEDGIGCCIWYPFQPEGEDEEMGMCFDFDYNDIDDLMKLLQDLKAVEPEVYA